MNPSQLARRVVVAATVAYTGAAAPARAERPLALQAVARAEDSLAPDDHAGPGAARLVAAIRWLRDEVRTTRYQARTEVRRHEGFYGWDCSGMAGWLMRRSTPRAFRALASRRPVARDFFRAIERAPGHRARRGWRRLGHVSEARPGDVFAWLRSPLSSSTATGHVGFLVGRPVEVAGWPGAFAARIVDATRLPHQDDTRTDGDGGGFGFGTMLFVTGDRGEVVGYGWFGTASAGLMPARVLFGRLGE